MISQLFPLAVHLSDGVLSPAWLIAGFAGMALLMLPAMLRVRDEEIPRIALLTAAFFVASLLHVRLGPTSVHLLLNGLVGVILGWRAGLAIPVGLTLQALLLGHGGFYTLGVNACILTLPALLMGGLYHLLRASGPRLPDFVVGCVIGLVGVLLTLTLNALVLLYGGAEDWKVIVAVVFVSHLPIAVLEGVIMGFTVAFLARVKPELLNGVAVGFEAVGRKPSGASDLPEGLRPTASSLATHHSPPAALLALASLLLLASPALAHRLEIDCRILPDGRIEVESWFDSGDSPADAKVQVFGPGNELRCEGTLDAAGKFIFRPERAEELKVVVNAGAGHRKEMLIPAAPAPRTPPDHAHEFPARDVLVGVGFLLALASFWMGLRNARELRLIRRLLTSAAPEIPLPATPPTGPDRG